MSTMNASEIISVLKSEIEDFDRKSGVQETGTVVRVGDGIATVFGMQHAMYGELVEFATKRSISNISIFLMSYFTNFIISIF